MKSMKKFKTFLNEGERFQTEIYVGSEDLSWDDVFDDLHSADDYEDAGYKLYNYFLVNMREARDQSVYNAKVDKKHPITYKVYSVEADVDDDPINEMYFDLEVTSGSGKKYRLSKYKSLKDLDNAILEEFLEDKRRFGWIDYASDYENKDKILNNIAKDFEFIYLDTKYY